MGKTSSNGRFVRKQNEKYFTIDARAVEPLLQLLKPGTRFVEPCAGAGHLIRHLERHGHICATASDIDPEENEARPGLPIYDGDVRQLTMLPHPVECFITNPPWDRSRKLFWEIVDHCMRLMPTWILHSHSTLAAASAAPYLRHAVMTTPTPRLQWEPGTEGTSSQPTCWTLFDCRHEGPMVYRPAQGVAA